MNRPESTTAFVLLALATAVACQSGKSTSSIYPGDPSAGPFEHGLFSWHTKVVNYPPLTAAPGGTWSVEFDLELDLRQHRPEMGRFNRIVAVVYGERTYDESGFYRSNGSDIALSSRYTTVGVPIAAPDLWPDLRLIQGRNSSPFEGSTSFDLPGPDKVARVHRFHGRINVDVPSDIQPGWWRPRMTLLVEVQGVKQPVFLTMFYRPRQQLPPRGFPLVQIGQADSPRFPWTAFPAPRLWGRVGTLPLEYEGKVGLIAHSIFPTELILPPGRYPVGPGLPTLTPINALPEVYRSEELLPQYQDEELVGEIHLATCELEGPDGTRVPCESDPAFIHADAHDPSIWKGPALGVDLSRTGSYRLHMAGTVTDPQGRVFDGGGTYVVHSALPLSFSTSCKPGTSFLVGNAYPAKVNVNPPVKATVEVTVQYYPNSDPARKRTWEARGNANRFGHFTPDVPPIVFDEPGEYLSLVKATYRDNRGRLWMGLQSSYGVIAPVDPEVRIRPASRVSDDVALTSDSNAIRYEDRLHPASSVMFQRKSLVRAVHLPGVPRDPADTLFLALQPDSLEVETRFTADVPDPRLARYLLDAATLRSAVLPRSYQRPGRPWKFLEDVVMGNTRQSLVWTSASPDRRTDLPIGPVSLGPLNPNLGGADRVVDGWIVQGAVRPGLAAVAAVTQRPGWGEFWSLSPNAFGFQINSGKNGDLPGDIYRVQAGLVLKDLETGINHYDLYSATMVMVDGALSTSSVLPPGKRPIDWGPKGDQYIILASDTHDGLEVGEELGFGGMVFPNVPADVTWTVTMPSGVEAVASGQADRRGIVRGTPRIPIDEPGVVRIRARARYGDLEGGIPGTPDGTYFVCAAPSEDPLVLTTSLPGVTNVEPTGTVRIPLKWPEGLTDVSVHFGVITPGRVLEQGRVQPNSHEWTYGFSPMEAVVHGTNFSVRVLSLGWPELFETVVFQFCLEAMDGDRKVVDSLRFVLRGDRLLNLKGL